MASLSAAIAEIERCRAAAASIRARFPDGYPGIIDGPMPPDAARDLLELQDDYLAAQQQLCAAYGVVQELYCALAETA